MSESSESLYSLILGFAKYVVVLNVFFGLDFGSLIFFKKKLTYMCLILCILNTF